MAHLHLRTGIPILVGQEVIRFPKGVILPGRPGQPMVVDSPIARVIDIAPLNRQAEVELKGTGEHQTWPLNEMAVVILVPEKGEELK